MPHHVLIESNGCELSSEGKCLIIRRPESRPTTLPMTQIGSLLIIAKTHIDTMTLLKLQREKIRVVISDRRHQTLIHVGDGPNHGHVMRRIEQYKLVTQPEQVIALSRQLLRHKMHSQWKSILHWRVSFPEKRYSLTTCMRLIRRNIRKLDSYSSLPSLRGIEASSSRAEFKALRTITSSSWGFIHRNRRPPKDPVNCMLSLAFTLLHSEAEHALKIAGLDPMLGLLHEPSYNRASLACDLSELFRSRVINWVVTLIRRREIQTSDFKMTNNGCLILKAGQSKFYIAWYGARDELSADIQKTARHWAQHHDTTSIVL
jgi:CRISPR-associated protein Cas1